MAPNNFNIRQIEAFETWPIRHVVMWPDKPINYVQLKNDMFGKHFGLFVDDKIVSVVSLFGGSKEIQFRKFATLKEYQGRGYGTVLLKHIIEIAKKEGYQKLWCNARVNKTAFYEKFHFKQTNKQFVKGGIQYVIVEKDE